MSWSYDPIIKKGTWRHTFSVRSFDGLDLTRTLNISHALPFIFHLYMPFSLTVRYLTDGRVSLKAYNHQNSRFFFSFQHNLTKLFTGKILTFDGDFKVVFDKKKKKKRILHYWEMRMTFINNDFYNEILIM